VKKDYTPPPRFTLGAREASAMLSVSRDHFERHVAPDLKVIRSGRRKLYLVSEITSWAEQNATRTL
jgi:hypothetical protein